MNAATRRHACLCNLGTRCTRDCDAREFPLHIKIQLDLEKRGSHTDVERIEATLAKFRAAEQDDVWLAKFRAARQDDAAWLALFAETTETVSALEQVAAGRLRDWGDPPAVQRRRRAAFIKRQHATRVSELRRRGEPAPVTQAWKELAKQHGFRNAYACKRWVGRISRRG